MSCKPIGQVDASAVPRFAGFRTFARLPRIEDVEETRVAILGAPFDGGGTFRTGSRFGPAAVREASLLLRPFDPSLETYPFDRTQIADAGDVALNPVDIEAAHLEITEAATSLHSAGAAVIGLGGDHSVSLPLLRAAAERHGPLGLLQLDAHTDTWDSYFGAKLTHGTMFRRAIEEGIIEPHRSVQIGLRGSLYSREDNAENKGLGFATYTSDEIFRQGLEPAVEMVAGMAAGPVYLTLDIDVLDPAFAPGTGTPEVGGITTRELTYLLTEIDRHLGERIVSADVVEVLPPYDVSSITAIAAANAAYKMVGILSRA